MADDIKKQSDSSLKPVNKRLNRVEGGLDDVKNRLDGVENRLTGVEGRLNNVERKLDGVHDKLDKNTAILIGIESRLNGFADAWKINRQRLGRLQKRVIKIEKHLGLSTMRDFV